MASTGPKFTDLPWGVVYSHVDSPGAFRAASHPAVAYELIMDLAIFAIIWPLRNRFRPDWHGLRPLRCAVFHRTLLISFLRVEANTYFGGALNEAQIVSLVVIAITVPLLVYKAQIVRTPRRRPAAARRADRERGRIA